MTGDTLTVRRGVARRDPAHAGQRAAAWAAAQQVDFDVGIVGAGVGGAALHRELCRRGYRVLLVDRRDFAGATSQNSGMLVWGGLLYLRRLDLLTVHRLSAERDALLLDQPDDVVTARFRYLPLRDGGRPAWLVRAALEAYWWLGRRRRSRPRCEAWHGGARWLRSGRFRESLVYEEARLVASDGRLVLDWILEGDAPEQVALNHCALVHARREGHWRLQLEDRLGGGRVEARAHLLVNAAGPWADDLARSLGIVTRHRHELSKGVYLGLPRPAGFDDFLAFETGSHGDALTFTPWGPVALWGPTETRVERLEHGLVPDVHDLRWLLDQANANLARAVSPADVVSLRCGVRPLAVRRAYSGRGHPLDLSRRHVVDVDGHRAALTLFGGKITSAPALARRVADRIARDRRPTLDPSARVRARPTPPAHDFLFPGLDTPVVDPNFCAANERCETLDDYLRRRTNIAQWVPRLGLGRHDEHRDTLRRLAEVFHGHHGPVAVERAVQTVVDAADAQDRLLARV